MIVIDFQEKRINSTCCCIHCIGAPGICGLAIMWFGGRAWPATVLPCWMKPCCCWRSRIFRLCSLAKYSARWTGSRVCKWACVWASRWMSWRWGPCWLPGHCGLVIKTIFYESIITLQCYFVAANLPCCSDELWLSRYSIQWWCLLWWLLLLLLRWLYLHIPMLRRLARSQHNLLILYMHFLQLSLVLHHSLSLWTNQKIHKICTPFEITGII